MRQAHRKRTSVLEEGAGCWHCMGREKTRGRVNNVVTEDRVGEGWVR